MPGPFHSRDYDRIIRDKKRRIAEEYGEQAANDFEKKEWETIGKMHADAGKGAIAGAILGTIIAPGVGTYVGALIGGIFSGSDSLDESRKNDNGPQP